MDETKNGEANKLLLRPLNGDEKESTTKTTYTLDELLKEVGTFGWYQVMVYSLLAFYIFFWAVYNLSFVFTLSDLNYRCRIPQCDDDTNEYNPKWLVNAVPFVNGKPEKCFRYEYQNFSEGYCAANAFDSNEIVKCTEFVFETEENSLTREFNLTCDENKWMLSFIGTLHNFAHLFNLFFSGYLSDRFGRRTIMIYSVMISASLGMLKSFAWNYMSFFIIGFVDTFLSAGYYSACHLLAMEMLNPKMRVLGGTIIFSSTSTGKCILALLAMFFPDWRTLLRVGNTPGLFIVLLFWIIPESYRWQLSQGRKEKAAKELQRIARINGVKLSESVQDILQNRPEDILLNADVKSNNENKSQFSNIFQYPKFMVRIVLIAICWFLNIYIIYGMTVHAVSIGGNKYIAFIAAQMIEIPGAYLVVFISNKFGRKKILFTANMITTTALITLAFIPYNYFLNLTLFLIGKLSIAVSFNLLYIFTAENFPTSMRHTLSGMCSGIGRLGSAAAVQAPLLESIYKPLASLSFGVSAACAGLIILTCPETIGLPLPETIEEVMVPRKQRKNEALLKNQNSEKPAV